MREPTAEQGVVLTCPARIRIVRAAPGSGKTWLVAEAIRRELSEWPTSTSGIAALSFTRVGGAEILDAVGQELGHPHFVGTIDAFLFRYVVRPFLVQCYSSFASPRLVPAELGAQNWNKFQGGGPSTIAKGIRVFDCVWIGESSPGEELIAAYKPRYDQGLKKLNGSELTALKKAKKAIWTRSGQLTHSDAALCASRVLADPALGPSVCGEIARRFPLIIVDELQDTGYFLGKCILSVLAKPPVRGLLVGDPDQAIFEFNGARPDLFNRFEELGDAQPLTLASSRRCPVSIANVASKVKDSGGVIGGAEARVGRALLVRYSDMVKDVRTVATAVRAAKGDGTVKVIARLSSTLLAISGLDAKRDFPKLGCSPLNHVQRGVTQFRQGLFVQALGSVRAAMELALFDVEGLSDDDLVAKGIDPSEWKALVTHCLLRANNLPTAGSVFEWQSLAGATIDDEISRLPTHVTKQHVAGTLKPQKRKYWEKSSAGYMPGKLGNETALTGLPLKTVHSVKGETHDVTIVVYPDSKNGKRCPSAVWWSDDEGDREERRIAYVALTRTQGDLILCVSQDTYERLSVVRAEFIKAFECMTVPECVIAVGAA